jgi:hypothetical protein
MMQEVGLEPVAAIILGVAGALIGGGLAVAANQAVERNPRIEPLLWAAISTALLGILLRGDWILP